MENITINDCSVAEAAVASVASVSRLYDGDGLRFSLLLQPENIPSVLRRILELHADAAEQDMMMLGVLNIVSGMTAAYAGDERSACAIYGIYDGRRVYAPLYNIVYARAGSGKGALVHCLELLRPMREEAKRQYELEMAEYRRRCSSYEALKRQQKSRRGSTEPLPEEPVEPPYRCPLVAGNSTTAALYRTLSANEGWGLMFETEADTITQMLKSDFGNYSDLLRKAFHHEPISCHRATDNLHIDIEEPRLSVMLTCTPGQIPSLFEGNAENGMASRFLYYGLPSQKPEFKNVFAHASESLSDEYRAISDALAPLFQALAQRRGRPMQFVMTERQQSHFMERFSAILQDQTRLLGDAYQGFVFRLALSCFRYAMVLTLLRRLDELPLTGIVFSPDEIALQCHDADCQTALAITETLARHTALVFNTVMPDTADPFAKETMVMTENEKDIFCSLPMGQFKTSEFISLTMRKCNVSERTAYKTLKNFVLKYKILQQVSSGIYRRYDAHPAFEADSSDSACGNGNINNSNSLI